nr:hypothetical protein [Tanacetum cinerariifolium]GEW10256.1 hypothetical protein [Tanacetum cinerariifolium]
MNSCELCGNDAYYGYDCPPQVPFVYNQDPCFNQDFVNNFPQTSPSFPQQYLCYENCGGPHATFQCQPMNQNFYNSNSSGFDQIQPSQYPIIHHPPQETSVEILQAKENLMQYIQTFLRKFNHISFRETPKNRPAFYDDEDEYSIQYKEYLENSSNVIPPVLPTEDPDNSLSMGDKHLSTIPEMESNEVTKSSVENLVPIPSESEGISNDTCDVPFCDNSHPLDVLTDHFELFSDFNNDCTSSDDDYFEDIDYVEASPPDFELVSLKEVQDDILHEKLLNTNLLIAKIESLSDTFTPDCVLNLLPHFLSPLRIVTLSLRSSILLSLIRDILYPNSGLLAIIQKRRVVGELTSIAMEGILGELRVYVPNVLPTHPTLLLDLDFIPSDDSIRSGIEVPFSFETRNKIFDPGIFFDVQSKRFLSRDTFSPPFSLLFFSPPEVRISFLTPASPL